MRHGWSKIAPSVRPPRSAAAAGDHGEEGSMKEFKEFLLKTNALALAVGVILGGAVGKVVTSLVNDVLMPPIGLLLGQVDFGQLFVDLSGGAYMTLEEAQKAGAPTLNYGMFINTLVDFVIVAFCIFIITKMVGKASQA
jgi:large conductance mechanosensitive channel